MFSRSNLNVNNVFSACLFIRLVAYERGTERERERCVFVCTFNLVPYLFDLAESLPFGGKECQAFSPLAQEPKTMWTHFAGRNTPQSSLIAASVGELQL